jgi:hypothetical protein
LKNYLDHFNLNDVFMRIKSLALEAAMQEGNDEIERGEREVEFRREWTDPGSRAVQPVIKQEVVDDEGFYGEEDVDETTMAIGEPSSEEAAIRF